MKSKDKDKEKLNNRKKQVKHQKKISQTQTELMKNLLQLDTIFQNSIFTKS